MPLTFSQHALVDGVTHHHLLFQQQEIGGDPVVVLTYVASSLVNVLLTFQVCSIHLQLLGVHV